MEPLNRSKNKSKQFENRFGWIDLHTYDGDRRNKYCTQDPQDQYICKKKNLITISIINMNAKFSKVVIKMPYHCSLLKSNLRFDVNLYIWWQLYMTKETERNPNQKTKPFEASELRKRQRWRWNTSRTLVRALHYVRCSCAINLTPWYSIAHIPFRSVC